MYTEDHHARSRRAVAPSHYVVMGDRLLCAETGQQLTDGYAICALKTEVL